MGEELQGLSPPEMGARPFPSWQKEAKRPSSTNKAGSLEPRYGYDPQNPSGPLSAPPPDRAATERAMKGAEFFNNENDLPLLHHNQRREGYLHKRAGWFRWTVRYFHLRDGTLQWFRPSFLEQLKQQRPSFLQDMAPARKFDLRTELASIELKSARFPFSTRVVLGFKNGYKLELRAEREPAIRDWYEKLKSYLVVEEEVLMVPGRGGRAEEDQDQVDHDPGGRGGAGEEIDECKEAGPWSANQGRGLGIAGALEDVVGDKNSFGYAGGQPEPQPSSTNLGDPTSGRTRSLSQPQHKSAKHNRLNKDAFSALGATDD